MLSDIEIAQSAKMLPISQVAEKIGIDQDELEFYGKYKAKLSDELIARLEDRPDGKLILVTAINPTPAGEGKTTTTVGLADGLRRIGKTSVLNLLRRRVEQENGAAIYFDCTKYSLQRWNSFLQEITRALVKKYDWENAEPGSICLPEDFELPSASSRYNPSKAILSFEEDMTKLYHALGDRRILLIFDEIEAISFEISPEQHWREGDDARLFWTAMRSISQTDNRLFSYVITGVNPRCVEIQNFGDNQNPIFGALTPRYVSLFDLEDVKKMVTDIGGHLGLQFEEEIFTRLIDDYGGHPFLTRQVCSQINLEVLERGEIRPYRVSKFSYEKHAGDYRNKMEAVIEQILGVLQKYYTEEYELLKTLALDGSRALDRKSVV